MVGTMGTFLQVLAVWWDRYSYGQVATSNPWSDPTRIALYAGFAIVVLAVWRGLRAPRILPAATVPIRFVNVAGLKLAGAGSLIEIIALLWNETARQFLFTETSITPFPLALLTIGMLAVALGMVVGLAIEYGMIRRAIVAASTFKRWLTLVCVILAFASIWLMAAGVFLFTTNAFQAFPLNLVAAVLLALVVQLVLVPAKRVLPRFGAALSIGVVFNAVSYFFLVAVAKVPAYVPWGILPIASFEVLILGLKRVVNITRAALVSSTVIGLFSWATYYPFTLSMFPWSSSPQLLLAAGVLGGFAGGFLGNSAYAGLTSVVLGDVAG